MRQLPGYRVWLGHAGDGRDVGAILGNGIHVVVQLALEEPPAVLNRELVACRFPLIDGDGNAPWLIGAAVRTIAGFVSRDVPTLLVCGAGMSRSPAIAAAAIAIATNMAPQAALEVVTGNRAADVSPGLWRTVQTAIELERLLTRVRPDHLQPEAVWVPPVGDETW